MPAISCLQAISFDMRFPGAQHVYGIPERATSLSLKPTRGAWAGPAWRWPSVSSALPAGRGGAGQGKAGGGGAGRGGGEQGVEEEGGPRPPCPQAPGLARSPQPPGPQRPSARHTSPAKN